MTVRDSKRRLRRPPPPVQSQGDRPLPQVVSANNDFAAAKRHGTAAEAADARRRLQAAIDSARDAGANWTQIGNELGIARGNAYQQYRRRPSRCRGSDAAT